jgi:hypothetical protein
MPIPQFGLRQLAALINQPALKTPVERELGRRRDENIEACFNRPTSGAQRTLDRSKRPIIRQIARRVFNQTCCIRNLASTVPVNQKPMATTLLRRPGGARGTPEWRQHIELN